MRASAFVLAAVLGAAGVAGRAAADGPRPNVLVILADDLGYGDIGVYGCKDIPTPHVDSLAAGGVRCTSGYVSGSVCSPTRAGLMTGRYQQRHGMDWLAAGPIGLDVREKTLAERLKALGYATGHVGKWHLGEQPEFLPQNRGFDEFFGFLGGGRSYYPMEPKRNRDLLLRGGDQVGEKFTYLTDTFGDEAVAFIERHKARPWFLYLAFNAVHHPPEAAPEGQQRFARIEDPVRRIYAGMLARMDDNVGRVLLKLRALKLEENTLIFFLSDNGGPTNKFAPVGAQNTPLRGSKGDTWEGGIRVPFLVQWKARLPAATVLDMPVIQLDILPTAVTAAGGEVKPEWKLDGVNILPLLEGRADAAGLKARALYWRGGTNWAIRQGDWKLCVPQFDETVPRLFHLPDDISEGNDLAAKEPERVRQLKAAWDAWNAKLPQAKQPWPKPRPEKPKLEAPKLDVPQARPNILFLFADDWAWPHASCLGAPVVKTPTFDRLAREGVLFRNAFTAAPSCSPSRAAILTGQWHWRLEQGANLQGFLAAKYEVYPDLLEKAGYFVGLTGKGYGPGKIADRPRNPAGPSFKGFADFLAARPKGKPFCFWFGSHNPHRPYGWQSGAKGGMDPAKVAVPPYLPDNPTVREDICDYYGEVQAFDREAGQILDELEKTGELDNTLIVISGDNGWPFPRCKATCYDSGTHQPLAVRWGAKVKGGRVVDDFVSLADLAPTFLEAAGIAPPKTLTARSLLTLLLSDRSGQVDPTRDHVLTGMETHVPCRELGEGRRGGYPMRTILTKDFHYIRNFEPDRWPAGDPKGFEVPAAEPATYEQLAKSTFVAFADCDASPSKAWMVLHRAEAQVKPLHERAFGKRPARELYDLRRDPFEMRNLAADPAYADVIRKLDAQLMAELVATGDPRAAGKADVFDTPIAAPARKPPKPSR